MTGSFDETVALLERCYELESKSNEKAIDQKEQAFIDWMASHYEAMSDR